MQKLTKCPDCRKRFERYSPWRTACPQCGQTPEQAAARQAANAPKPRPEPTEEEILELFGNELWQLLSVNSRAQLAHLDRQIAASARRERLAEAAAVEV